MKKINHVIKDKVGIHARPAGMLVSLVSKFSSQITLTKGDNAVDAKRLLALLNMGVKYGDEITISIDGIDEEKAAEEIQEFLKENL